MSNRKLLLYFSWSRPDETGAPLGVIENRFPALFESRRMKYPAYEDLADAGRFDQGIAGFLDHIQKPNFADLIEYADEQLGGPVTVVERIADDGTLTALNADLLDTVDTAIIISFDSIVSRQHPGSDEVQAVKRFLEDPDNLLFVCPHHDIGDPSGLSPNEKNAVQLAEFRHHGDWTIPPQQGFGCFARTLLSEIGIPINNRYGLRPKIESDGSPSPIEIEPEVDRLGILSGVRTFNKHPHLPHFERQGDAVSKVDVLARQYIDTNAPPHPFTADGNITFDALLQSRPETFPGTVLIGDTTLWISTAGGIDDLHRMWGNVIQRSGDL